MSAGMEPPAEIFQSTLPVRGGTIVSLTTAATITNFNPPSPCGEGHQVCSCFSLQQDFNPPSPCGEGLNRNFSGSIGRNFNPPSPCGEGHLSGLVKSAGRHFNPPSPCGEGQSSAYPIAMSFLFQSTLPVRGGTARTTNISLAILQLTGYYPNHSINKNTQLKIVTNLLFCFC